MKIEKIPEIRFPEFQEAWQLCTIGQLGDVKTGKAFKSSEFNDNGKYLVITNKDIQSDIQQKKISSNRIDITEETVLDSYLLNGDNILITMDGVNIGKSSKYTNDRAVLAQRVGRITSKQLEFIYQIVKDEKFISEMQKVSVGNAIKHISLKQISDFSFYCPPKESEQEKIGNLLSGMDKDIYMKSNKLTTLKQTKQGFLQKMFPKEGESVPEIRFPGFSEKWSYKELGELINKVTEKNTNRKYNETFTNSAEQGIVSQRDYFEKDISNNINIDGYYIVQPDDFVYNPRISKYAPVGPIKRNKLSRTGIMSPLYYIFKAKDVDLDYLEVYFETSYWHTFMKLNGDSGARSDRFSIKDAVFRKMPIPLPDIEEQKKIANLLKDISKAIVFKEQELQALQQTKKAFLQKMFV
ncbi:restriction endonuclease subunit S [Sporosarcina koreensis]|uniref:restriction endonuclease subunit S n=1 Tax=Sporosarcina koreensis TaxID=334735 RepID=UPI000693ACD2|nr:restriction endonuclease subunit S [Sporosarcina koreensis]